MLTAPIEKRAKASDAEKRGSDWSRLSHGALDATLARGLARLPVGESQRSRAGALARDVARCWPPVDDVQDVTDLQSLAAAIAYAIVYVDHVPLTQAEVAACFRVSASLLRARFKDLRLRLDLTPGDARYATLRRR
jgi:hypothetical protein